MKASTYRNTCFAITAAKSSPYERLFGELFVPAITSAGYVLSPIAHISRESSIAWMMNTLDECDVCFADLSNGDPLISIALACAVAMKKPLCLVAEDAVDVDSALFTQGDVIRYPAHSLPSDYETLKNKITTKLSSFAKQPTIKLDGRTALEATTLSAETIIAPVRVTASAKVLSKGTSDDPIKFHEHLALKLIARHKEPAGITLRELVLGMNEYGIGQSTSVAVSSLKRHKYIESAKEQSADPQKVSGGLVMTQAGSDWLKANSKSDEMPAVPFSREGMDVNALVTNL